MKVANSIGRQAVPAGVFTGKSKQLYDCLYSLTRGAIVPSRTVRISRPRLMKKAHIGSRVTFDANVARLAAVGLIYVKQIPGEHEGNEYTIYLPEETGSRIESQPTQTSQSSVSGWTGYAQYQDSPDSLEPSHTSPGLSDDSSTSYGASKTFLNTNQKTDDEVFEELTKALKTAVIRIKGSPIVFTQSEKARWGEVGDVIVEELLDAARRAQFVSSVPAFLATHLRRRFARRISEAPSETPSVAAADESYDSGVEVSLPVELNADQMRQSAEMLSDLLRGDYTVEAITEQFSAGYKREDWDEVLRSAVELSQNR